MPQFGDDIFLGGNSSQTYMGTGNQSATATFTATISTTTLTVSALLSGDPLIVGQYVTGTSVAANTYITDNLGNNQYTLSQSSTQASPTTMFASGNALLGDPSPMSLGVGPLGRVYVWDMIPQTLQVANIVASQTSSAGGNLTLTAGTSAKTVVRSDGTSVIQVDVPRTLTVNSSTTARAFTVRGYDYYGQAMSEVITVLVAGTPVTGNKAFYQISTVSISGSATAVVVGTSDALGLPVRAFDAGYIVSVGWNNTLARDAGTFVVAGTATATTTTADVRGTYTPSSATNGSRRLVMTIAVPAIAVGPNATRVGALGVTQA